MPKTRHISTMLKAFLTGGLICCVGQSITYLIQLISPNLDEKTTAGFTTLFMILITCILTGFGIYDKIGSFGGAGSIVPITGFANSIVSPAIEHKKEGIVLGLCHHAAMSVRRIVVKIHGKAEFFEGERRVVSHRQLDVVGRRAVGIYRLKRDGHCGAPPFLLRKMLKVAVCRVFGRARPQAAQQHKHYHREVKFNPCADCRYDCYRQHRFFFVNGYVRCRRAVVLHLVGERRCAAGEVPCRHFCFRQ